MNVKYMFLLFFSLVLTMGCKSSSQIEALDLETISTLLNQGSVKIIDVRTPEEYDDVHIPGAINYPIESLLDSLTYLDRMEDIIVVCRTGNKSSQAKKLLKENGFEKVHNGGKWQNVDEIIKKLEKNTTENN